MVNWHFACGPVHFVFQLLYAWRGEGPKVYDCCCTPGGRPWAVLTKGPYGSQEMRRFLTCTSRPPAGTSGVSLRRFAPLCFAPLVLVEGAQTEIETRATPALGVEARKIACDAGGSRLRGATKLSV